MDEEGYMAVEDTGVDAVVVEEERTTTHTNKVKWVHKQEHGNLPMRVYSETTHVYSCPNRTQCMAEAVARKETDCQIQSSTMKIGMRAIHADLTSITTTPVVRATIVGTATKRDLTAPTGNNMMPWDTHFVAR